MTYLFQRSLIAGVSTLGLMTGMAQADQQILDDLIVGGSLCVGQDCSNGESFGFDTIRMKENNLRIRAMDTSNTASFPSVDWQLTFNDSGNGGANKFSIDDLDNAKTPFTIEASAPSHSLYVEDGGRIGLGTSTPVVELHVASGDSPTLRLEQDGTSGFTPQTWDVAGNETNFFVRDASNGSTLPLRIRPSAPQNALYIDSDGDIGMGTASPTASLHIQRAGVANIHLDNTTNGDPWAIQSHSGDFRVTTLPNGSADIELSLSAEGNLTLEGLLSIRDGVTAPAAQTGPNQAQIYVDSADGDLKVLFSDGTVKVLATDS